MYTERNIKSQDNYLRITKYTINSTYHNFILLKCYYNQILGFQNLEKNVEVL